MSTLIPEEHATYMFCAVQQTKHETVIKQIASREHHVRKGHETSAISIEFRGVM
jgi:hypothetical protein